MILNGIVNFHASRETSLLKRVEMLSLLGIVMFSLVPIKYTFLGYSEFVLGFFSDFTAISLYISMIFALIYIAINIYSDFSRGNAYHLSKLLLIFIAVSAVLLLTTQIHETMLSVYAMFKIGCALLVGYYVYKSEIWLKYRKSLLWITLGFGAFNAILAVVQFTLQTSSGLSILGESPLSVTGYDIAKIVAHETTYIRGYGLFPHPNILGAVLATISILNLYLLTKTTQIPRFLLWTIFFVITSGLFVSFSRAGLLAFGLGFITWWILSFRNQENKAYELAYIPIVWLLTLSSIFFPWLSQRATWSDQAVLERGMLNTATIEVIKDNWLVGTGPGTNLIMLHGKLSDQYDNWQIQPVHNYFLIIIGELGMVGLIILIFLIYLFYKILKSSLLVNREYNSKKTWQATLASISLMIFILFWFDHYFYTIWPTQMLLAIFIGLVAKELLTPSRQE